MLKDIQDQITTYILNPVASDYPKLALNFAERLAVHHEGYRQRAFEAVLEAFPMTARYLGEKKFYELATSYGCLYPTALYDLFELTKDFPAYVKEHCSDKPVLADLPQLEQLTAECFHAAALTGETATDFFSRLRKNPQNFTIHLQPWVRSGAFNWSLYEYYKGQVAEPKQQEQWLLFYRENWQVKIVEISREQFLFLNALKSNPSLAEACEALAQESGNQDSHPLDRWLTHWLNLGLFTHAVSHDQSS